MNFEIIMMANKKLKIINIDFLMNPLINGKNAKRIISIWKPIIEKIKLKSKPKLTKLKKSRPSPSESATEYNVGKKKKGNDDNMYFFIKTKNGINRWVKL